MAILRLPIAAVKACVLQFIVAVADGVKSIRFHHFWRQFDRQESDDRTLLGNKHLGPVHGDAKPGITLLSQI